MLSVQKWIEWIQRVVYTYTATLFFEYHPRKNERKPSIIWAITKKCFLEVFFRKGVPLISWKFVLGNGDFRQYNTNTTNAGYTNTYITVQDRCLIIKVLPLISTPQYFHPSIQIFSSTFSLANK